MVNLLEEYLSQMHSACGLPISFNFIVTEVGLARVKPGRVEALKGIVFTARFINRDKISVSWDGPPGPDQTTQKIYLYYEVQRLIREGIWKIT